jgi:hypothetical protein
MLTGVLHESVQSRSAGFSARDANIDTFGYYFIAALLRELAEVAQLSLDVLI